MTFRVAGARTVAEGAFLTLEVLDVAGPGDAFERVVVRHPGAVAVVALDDAGRVLLVRQYRAALDREVLEIPAGKLDVEGEAPEFAARRELEEETGMRAGELVPLGTFANSPGFCDEVTHLYLATGLVAGERPEGLRHEEAAMTIERHGVEAVDDLLAGGEVADAKTFLGLLLAARRGRSGARHAGG